MQVMLAFEETFKGTTLMNVKVKELDHFTSQSRMSQ